MSEKNISRRKFIAATGTGAAIAVAGCTDIFSVETVDSLPTPSRGSEDAPVVLGVFEDFRCPGCRMFHTEIEPDLESYIEDGNLRRIHFDLPLGSTDELSYPAANIARAAQDEFGDQEFWEVSDILYDNQQSIRGSNDLISLVGDNTRLNEEQISTAIAGRYDPVIETDRGRAAEREISSAPTPVINDEVVTSNTLDGIRSAIIDAIESNTE